MKQISKLMKQAQQMQENMQKMQEELAQQQVTGEAGGGMVKIVMNCRHETISVHIDEQVVGDDKDMLEDLIAAAVNDAVRKVEETTKEKFSGLAGGLNLPGMNLPF
ncbi:MAG: YbaB/EbfC family nucleoid-associated protein [Gammaproteobacteria bacterium]|nr:YbaB/EbfC family nucleoid-associated protein [Gammaproteobacteria bacterium]MDH3768978.1 YbaB/EbfC family nucleoid-associated protein [Gammaproteobacteria bacterium]